MTILIAVGSWLLISLALGLFVGACMRVGHGPHNARVMR